MCLSVFLCLCVFKYVSVPVCLWFGVFLCMYFSVNVAVYVSVQLCFCLGMFLCMYVSVSISVCVCARVCECCSISPSELDRSKLGLGFKWNILFRAVRSSSSALAHLQRTLT